MFEKKIYITPDALIVGKKKIKWSEIVGMRIQEGKILEFLTPNFPRAEIFLEDGKVIVVSNRNLFFVGGSSSDNAKKISCKEAIERIEKNAVNIKPILKKWIEWRLLAPIIIAEIIALVIALSSKIAIDKLVLVVILAGIIGALFGAYWERKERKKF